MNPWPLLKSSRLPLLWFQYWHTVVSQGDKDGRNAGVGPLPALPIVSYHCSIFSLIFHFQLYRAATRTAGALEQDLAKLLHKSSNQGSVRDQPHSRRDAREVFGVMLRRKRWGERGERRRRPSQCPRGTSFYQLSLMGEPDQLETSSQKLALPVSVFAIVKLCMR